MDATNVEPEVGGRGYYRWVECWHCHSMRRVYWEFPGQTFICGSCGVEYIPNN
jgi:ribosomal protein S27E